MEREERACSSAHFRRSGVSTGMSAVSAKSCTGDLRGERPRPAARGGWRIDGHDLMASGQAAAASAGTAKSGVPKKMMRMGAS